MIAFRPALSRRYRLHQSKRQISQNSGCGVNLSADIDMVDLWRDLAIFSSKLEIELNPCLGPLVLRSPSALSRLQVAYWTGSWEANYYGAVFGQKIHGADIWSSGGLISGFGVYRAFTGRTEV